MERVMDIGFALVVAAIILGFAYMMSEGMLISGYGASTKAFPITYIINRPTGLVGPSRLMHNFEDATEVPTKNDTVVLDMGDGKEGARCIFGTIETVAHDTSGGYVVVVSLQNTMDYVALLITPPWGKALTSSY